MPRMRYNPNAMKRLLRILLNAATMLSLLMCVAIVVLWIRSYWVGDISYHVSPLGVWYLSSWGGRLTSCDGNHGQGKTDWWQSRRLTGSESDSPVFMRTKLNRLGFVYRVEANPSGRFPDDWDPGSRPPPAVVRTRYVRVPYWFPATGFAMVPVARLVSMVRRRRGIAAGRCESCGYDLRATPERCPECGTIPTQ
jgi:hypothetical protein